MLNGKRLIADVLQSSTVINLAATAMALFGIFGNAVGLVEQEVGRPLRG